MTLFLELEIFVRCPLVRVALSLWVERTLTFWTRTWRKAVAGVVRRACVPLEVARRLFEVATLLPLSPQREARQAHAARTPP